jgi:DNA topoisomerase-1
MSSSNINNVKNLFIVESPAKNEIMTKYIQQIAKTSINKDLSNFEVIGSYGYFGDLSMASEKYLLKDIMKTVPSKPSEETLKRKKDIMSSIKQKCENSDIVWLAMDNDQDGETIAWHITDFVGKHNYRRVTFDAFTKSHVAKAIDNYRDINMDLVVVK